MIRYAWTIPLLLVLGACTSPQVSAPRPATGPVDVKVTLIKPGGQPCRIKLKTAANGKAGGQRCPDFGEADGVACAEGDDRVTWRFNGPAKAAALRIELSDPAACPFNTYVPGEKTRTCTLANPADGVAVLKYDVVEYDGDGDPTGCRVDPYIIVRRR